MKYFSESKSLGTIYGVATIYMFIVCIAAVLIIPTEESIVKGIAAALVWPFTLLTNILV